MNRSNFFKALLVMVASPTVIAQATEQKCFFDETKINDRLKELRKYPLTESECHPPEWAKKYKTVRVENGKTYYEVKDKYMIFRTICCK